MAVDQNQLTMELMKKIAEKHGFACLLHEKPFAGLNGSGKHNNWSLTSDTGINLLEPGESPQENAQFLLFLVAVIKAVDEYQDLLRISVASAGNDHRLGGFEAPPAIISMFLGDELTEILEAIASGGVVPGRGRRQMKLGVHVLPPIPRDTTDRNRTSPFAFTGNKFEFRMLGSSFSVADPNTTLNTIVAASLRDFHEELKDAKDFNRIVFNGNNYAPEWVAEAEKRGLLNLVSSPEAFDTFLLQKNVDLFSSFHIFNSVEMHARYEILNEEYSKTVHIEAVTLVDMVNRDIVPAVSRYSKDLAESIRVKKEVAPELECKVETDRLRRISALLDGLAARCDHLDELVDESSRWTGSDLAHFCQRFILPQMQGVREVCDQLELITDHRAWPYPTYGEMLFYV